MNKEVLLCADLEWRVFGLTPDIKINVELCHPKNLGWVQDLRKVADRLETWTEKRRSLLQAQHEAVKVDPLKGNRWWNSQATMTFFKQTLPTGSRKEDQGEGWGRSPGWESEAEGLGVSRRWVVQDHKVWKEQYTLLSTSHRYSYISRVTIFVFVHLYALTRILLNVRYYIIAYLPDLQFIHSVQFTHHTHTNTEYMHIHVI